MKPMIAFMDAAYMKNGIDTPDRWVLDQVKLRRFNGEVLTGETIGPDVFDLLDPELWVPEILVSERALEGVERFRDRREAQRG